MVRRKDLIMVDQETYTSSPQIPGYMKRVPVESCILMWILSQLSIVS